MQRFLNSLRRVKSPCWHTPSGTGGWRTCKEKMPLTAVQICDKS